MSSSTAQAEVFLMAFRALPKKEKLAVIKGLLLEGEFREDLLDIAVFASRENEVSQPIEVYLAARQ